MNRSTADIAGAAQKRIEVPSARLRGLVAGLAIFAAGIALSALWFSHAPSHGPAVPEGAHPPALSDATKAVLHRLGSPVEIRFYSLLDPASISDSRRDFSGRVDQLLSQYEREAGGRITVARVNSISSSAAKAAEADGIRAFNIDKGDACFFGIAVVRGQQKQSLSSLAPEWEQALESDLSRAIAGVDVAGPQAQPAPKADVASLEAVKRAIPNLDSVSVEDGSRLLRVSALAEFQRTGQEMQAKVKQAEERFLQAQDDQSKEEQEAALKHLRQFQREQTKRLEEIALNAKAQQEALQQLKGAAH
jgi:ABC-type uncharacterized transport system